MQHITAKAPGRICLFGDHQDYLKLPVIACAIDRQVILKAIPNSSELFQIFMPDIGKSRSFSTSEMFKNFAREDHYASVLRVVRRYGCNPKQGYDITIRSTIPINAGVSSSSAIVLAWLQFLLNAYGCNQELTPKLLAQLAYEAEVLEHNSPGGKMDQFTIALGNIIHIDTSKEFGVKMIGTKLNGLVLGESGIPKETIGLLGNLRSNAEKAIAQVTEHLSTFKISEATLSELPSLLPYVDTTLHPFLTAAIKNHEITQAALEQFQQPALNYREIGALMTAHHMVLKEDLKITVPLIDDMIAAALNAGAYGAKIVGSGGGGSIAALAPDDLINDVTDAIKNAGAANAYRVAVTGGCGI